MKRERELLSKVLLALIYARAQAGTSAPAKLNLLLPNGAVKS